MGAPAHAQLVCVRTLVEMLKALALAAALRECVVSRDRRLTLAACQLQSADAV